MCKAAELFYGGQAGGGKTDLGLGLALTVHKRALILRRLNSAARPTRATPSRCACRKAPAPPPRSCGAAGERRGRSGPMWGTRV